MEFKDRLKKARKHAKLNQKELAERIGVRQTSISDLESGVSDIQVALARMEGRFDAMDAKLDTLATKAEASQLETRLIRWGVGTVIAVGALVFTIMRLFPAA